MVRCIDCVKLEKCAKTSGKPQIVEVVPGCEDGKRKPFTNGDRIRGMLDTELAKMLYENSWNFELCKAGIVTDGMDTEEDWLDWLKQEANDNK